LDVSEKLIHYMRQQANRNWKSAKPTVLPPKYGISWGKYDEHCK